MQDAWAVKGVDVVKDCGNKANDIFSGGSRTERVVWVQWCVDWEDGNSQFGSCWLRFRSALVGVGRMGLVAGVAGGWGLKVGTMFVQVWAFAVGTGGGIFTGRSEMVIVTEAVMAAIGLST